MTSKLFFSVVLFLISAATLSAQATTSLYASGMGDSDVNGVVDLLEHNALMALSVLLCW